MFDSIDENPILKEKGVKIGNLSQYLPKEDFELTPEQKQLANSTIKEKNRIFCRKRRNNKKCYFMK